MSEKLLIVEDDKKLNDGIRLALKNDSYFFYQCQTLQKARACLKNKSYTKHKSYYCLLILKISKINIIYIIIDIF